MSYRHIVCAGAAVCVLGFVSAGYGPGVARSQSSGAFIDPLILNQSLCTASDPRLSRKATFMRLGYAMAQTPDTPISGNPFSEQTLSTVGYDISTSSMEAQAAFNRGLAYTFGFNHGAAIAAFKEAQAADPNCAMCYWGEAFALGPNINAPMDESAVEPAFAASRAAIRLIDTASPAERALITAVASRYGPAPLADRAGLDTAFADAMETASRSHPENDLIAVIAAEANLDTQPWVYWDATGRTPAGRTARTLELLEQTLARSPDYPPAIHLYIHTTEASTDPYRAAAPADRLAALTPELGHLVHMPSHTYFRIGRWKQSLDHNIAAVAADEAFMASNTASPFYEFGYYTHNVHFAMTSAQMAGARETGLEMARLLDARLPLEVAANIPSVQPIKVAPLYALAQFAEPDEILALPDPGADLPFVQAAWHYARGEAFARLGQWADVTAAAAAIDDLAGEDLFDLTEANIPAEGILDISRLTLLARAAAANGDYETAIDHMETAVALQDGFPYMEPPFWYYPARQTLAAMVLRSGDGERAEQVFLETLVKSPNNAYAYYGLSEAYGAQGDRRARRYARRLYKDAWLGQRRDRPQLDQL